MWAEQNVFYNQHTITTAVKVEDIQIKQAEIDALKHSQKDIHLPPEVDKVSRIGEYVANLPDNPPISHAMIDVNMSTVCQVHLPHRNYDIEPITPVPSPQVSRSTIESHYMQPQEFHPYHWSTPPPVLRPPPQVVPNPHIGLNPFTPPFQFETSRPAPIAQGNKNIHQETKPRDPVSSPKEKPELIVDITKLFL